MECINNFLERGISTERDDGGTDLGHQLVEPGARALDRAGLLENLDGVLLEVDVLGALLEDVEQAAVVWMLSNSEDEWEGELALGQVLAEALVLHVVLVEQVDVVVSDLEVDGERVEQRLKVGGAVGEGLHEPDGEAEEPAGLVLHHLDVLVDRGALQVVSPEDVEPLALVQPQHLAHVHIHGSGVAQRLAALQRQEVDVVGAVDGRRDPVDGVGHRLSPPQLRAVLDVVDPAWMYARGQPASRNATWDSLRVS